DIPKLADRSPSREVLLKADPDYVIGTAGDFVDNAAGTRKQLQQMGIQSYITKEKFPTTIKNQVYREIRDLAKIFGVPEKGDSIINGMKAEIARIKKKVVHKNTLKVAYQIGRA